MFEHFGGLKSAIHAARDGRSGDELLEVEGADKRAAIDPDYTIPKASDLAAWHVLLLPPASHLAQNELLKVEGAAKRAITNPDCAFPA